MAASRRGPGVRVESWPTATSQSEMRKGWAVLLMCMVPPMRRPLSSTGGAPSAMESREVWRRPGMRAAQASPSEAGWASNLTRPESVL